jgi:hypothetical protein
MSRVIKLKFCHYLCHSPFADAVQANEWRVSNQLGNIFSDFHGITPINELSVTKIIASRIKSSGRLPRIIDHPAGLQSTAFVCQLLPVTDYRFSLRQWYLPAPP